MAKKNINILIIDDDRSLVEVIKDHLEAKYNIYKAYNGKEGLEVLRQNIIDAIICDLLMPEMDGFEFIDIVSKNPQTKDIPIIVASVIGDEKAKSDYKLKTFDFIKKPIDFTQLIKDLEQLFPKKEPREKKSILLISNDKQLLSAFIEYFDEKSFSLHKTNSYIQTLEFLKKQKPSLIILDNNCKDFSSIQFVKTIRNNISTTNIPVFIITDYSLDKGSGKYNTIFPTGIYKQNIPEREFINSIFVKLEEIEKEKFFILKSEYKKKILIADDEESIRQLLRDTLSDYYEIIESKDGEETLNKVFEEYPDLIILDIGLPKINGIEVCKKIKSDLFLKNIPVIMLTIREKEIDELQGYLSGAFEYITKPFDASFLLEKINDAFLKTPISGDINPLTHMPGEIVTDYILNKLIRSDKLFSYIYVDIKDLKFYNKVYGFNEGEKIIKLLSQIVIDSVRKYGKKDDFVAHLGSDDFVIITSPGKENSISRNIIENFDKKVLDFYKQDDKEHEFILFVDRKGNKHKIPLLSISIAIINNLYKKFTHIVEIKDIAFELIKYLKKKKGSNYTVDRRKK